MKRIISLLFVAATIILCLFALASCNDSPLPDETVYYTVSFDLDGGVVANKNLEEGLKVKENTVLNLSEYIPSKEGYAFKGYSDGTTSYALDATITVTANITVTAQWNKVETPNSYTITLDLSGGMLANTEISANEGTIIDLSNYVPSKEGYTFNGWKNGETDVARDAQITLSENMTLVAQWTEIPVYYNVTLNTDGGVVEGKDLTSALQVKKGTVLVLSEYIPEKNGHTFGGWKLGETVYQANSEITVTSDMELIALWTPIPTYTITFNANEGTLTNNSVTVMEGTIIQFADYIPTRVGFDFIGWKAENNTVYKATDAFTVTEATSFTAEWVLAATDASKFVFTLSADEQSYILSGLADGFDIANVVVPGEHNGRPVTEISNNVFYNKSTIISIDLSKCTALNVIGSYNFNDCANLTSVNLEGCVSLKMISNACFVSLPNLTILNLKGLGQLEEIGSHCFTYGGISMTQIPVEILDFSECVSLKKIGDMSFWYLSGVKVLDFSNTKLNSIGKQFIKQCSALETISLPATLNPANVDFEFITYTPKLKEIVVDSLSLYLCSENGVLYDIDKTIIYKYPSANAATEYTAPATIKTVKSQAFHDAKNLDIIDFTACTLHAIDWQAFAGCSSATLKVAFNADGKNENGSSVALGSNWNQGVPSVEYLKVVDISFSGVTDGATVTTESITLTANATYGEDEIELVVKLNGQIVVADGNTYILNLVIGENTIELSANHNGKSAQKTIKITRVQGELEVSTNLANRVISWYGSTVDFVIDAKSASGAALTSSAVEIKYNWGYGSYKQDMGVTMTDNADGTISVSVSYDTYYDWFYFEGDTEITLTVIVKDGDQSKTLSYTVDWREEAPSMSVTTTLSNNTISGYGSTVDFVIDAKSASGAALTSSSVEIQYNWGFGSYKQDMGVTMTDNADGTISVSVSYDTYYDWFYFEGDTEITLTVIVKDGTDTKSLSYTIDWKE